MNADAPPMAADKGKDVVPSRPGIDVVTNTAFLVLSAFIGGASAFIGVPRSSYSRQKSK